MTKQLPSSIHQRVATTSSGVQLWLNSQTASTTRNSYDRHAYRLKAITGKNPEDCTLVDLQYFQTIINNPPPSMIGRGLLFKTTPSTTSAVAAMQAIQSLFSFLQRAGVITTNPAVLIRTRSQKKRKRVDMSKGRDFVALCAALAKDDTVSQKDRLAGFAVLVLASTGLRASEAGEARREDIFWRDEKPWLNVFGKGSKSREVVMLDALLKLGTSICKDSVWLIPEPLRASGARIVVWRMVKRAAKLVGVPPDEVHPHLLRHFHASLLLDNGATLAETRDNLGHGNIAVTSDYLHADEDQRHSSISQCLNDLHDNPMDSSRSLQQGAIKR